MKTMKQWNLGTRKDSEVYIQLTFKQYKVWTVWVHLHTDFLKYVLQYYMKYVQFIESSDMELWYGQPTVKLYVLIFDCQS